MQMLYNSQHYAVVQFDIGGSGDAARPDGGASDAPAPGRGGYEIVDKSARREIFLHGPLAASFRQGVEALIETSPSEEELDDYVGRYCALMQQPLVLH